MVIFAFFKGVPREHPFYFSCFCVFSQETSENLSFFAFFKGVPREHPFFCIFPNYFFALLAGSIGRFVGVSGIMQCRQSLSLAERIFCSILDHLIHLMTSYFRSVRLRLPIFSNAPVRFGHSTAYRSVSRHPAPR